MNEEEKQAIEFMNNIEYKQVNSDEFYDNRDILINLLNKQQKEIEELKDFNTKLQATKDRLDIYDKENTLEIEKLKKEIERLKKFEKYYENEKVIWQRKDYISIDKIKEIKEDYKNRRSNMTQIIFSKYGKTQQTFNQAVVNEVIKVLDELLGE